MKQNKPVFGEVDGVLVDGPRSIQKVREYESMYPHFKKVSQEWNTAYESFMRNWLVDGGLLSEAQYNAMKEMYPNYVPTYRDNCVRTASFIFLTSILLSNVSLVFSKISL